MNEQLKQRLVGAIVLVALAVIFVPMLLEGDKRSGISPLGSNVPPAPESKAGAIDIPLELPPKAPDASVTPVERAVEPDAAPPPVAAARPTPPPARQEPVVIEPVKPADVAPVTKPEEAEAWAVQVGAFSDSRNAINLRDSLRAKGYPAYVEQIKSGNTASYRVRVGPVLSRSDAEAIQQKLASKAELRGIVVRHP